MGGGEVGGSRLVNGGEVGVGESSLVNDQC